jgi:lysophospholipase L1-like esterase
MTTGVERERRPPTDHQRSFGSALRDSPGIGPGAKSPVRNFFSHCIFGLGYVVVVFVVLASFLECASWIICSVFSFTRQAQFQSQKESPPYQGAEWAPQFWRDETLRLQKFRTYVPFRLWGVTEWHSKYTNNDSGAQGVLRRTINPGNCSSPNAVKVWMFGGSTMYGLGAPDWATLPSYLSRELNIGASNCVIVSNFGVEGYVVAQELILLEEQLKSGAHPDVVIFYDGINDSMAQCPPGLPTPHGAFLTIKSRIEGSPSARLDFLRKSYSVRLFSELFARYRRPRATASQSSDMQQRILSVMTKYEGSVRLERALANGYRFKVYTFWQPLLTYGHKPLVPFEQHAARADASQIPADYECLQMMTATYAEAERRAAQNGEFIFLGGVFDSTRDPVYIDQGHLGPRGNEVVAQAISNYMKSHSSE